MHASAKSTNMGSAKISAAQPAPMTDCQDKKTIKSILKNIFQKDKKKEKGKNDKDTLNVPQSALKSTETLNTAQLTPKVIQPPPKVTSVATLLENFQKLELKQKDEEEDELKNFSRKIIEDDRRSERIDSHSSQDSGFSEKETAECSEDEKDKHKNTEVEDKTEEDKDVVESLNKLKISEEKEKKRRLQTVCVSRGPIRSKASGLSNTSHPYISKSAVECSYSQSQIHKQALSGGQVIVNTDNFAEITQALTLVERDVQNFRHNSTQEQQHRWQDAQELIKDQTDDILSDFAEIQAQNVQDFDVNSFVQIVPASNPIEEFSNHSEFDNFDNIGFTSISGLDDIANESVSIFPTPPRSENIPSPMSDSQNYYYHSSTSLSPGMSSPINNNDYENYQEIQPQDLPRSVGDVDKGPKHKARERNPSTSSMTMKQFKDMQKELSTMFSKKECCQLNRKTCKEIFQEHMEKLPMEERKNLCVKVAGLDLKTAYGVLHHILLSLAQSTKPEDLQCALFSLICERVLAQKPALFTGDFGLSLIKSAVLRCHRRPILTRYLVQCVRTALKVDAGAAKGPVFHEVDDLGDNLLIACARAGEACADVLAELLRREIAPDGAANNGGDQRPLFDVHHTNTEGNTALHVACATHSARGPRLHIVHVLLDHGAADLWKGDVKGGDTSLHVAVNAPGCDLRLVMILFRHVDRKQWKQLAHAHNRSSLTPLEIARSATKSTTKQNYPTEVLEFLKKCR